MGSDTPRTDAATYDGENAYNEPEVVDAEHARQLERELNAAKSLNSCLLNVLGNIINDLTSNRDWLDPTTERIAREYVAKGNQP